METNSVFDHITTRLDNTSNLKNQPLFRRLDSMAVLLAEKDPCAAIAFFENKFYVSNNSGINTFIDRLMSFFNDVSSKQASNESKNKLLSESVDGGIQRHCDTNKLNKNDIESVDDSLNKQNEKVVKLSKLIDTCRKKLQVNKEKLSKLDDQTNDKKESEQTKIKEEYRNQIQEINTKLRNIPKSQEDKEENKLLINKLKTDKNAIYKQLYLLSNNIKERSAATEVDSIAGLMLEGEELKKQYNKCCEKKRESEEFLQELLRIKLKKEGLISDLLQLKYKRTERLKSHMNKVLKSILQMYQPDLGKNFDSNCFTQKHEFLSSSVIDGNETHCEMNLLQKLYNKLSQESMLIYMGIGLLSCGDCNKIFEGLNKILKEQKQSFSYRGTHRKVSKNWLKPKFAEDMGLESLTEQLGGNKSETYQTYYDNTKINNLQAQKSSSEAEDIDLDQFRVQGTKEQIEY